MAAGAKRWLKYAGSGGDVEGIGGFDGRAGALPNRFGVVIDLGVWRLRPAKIGLRPMPTLGRMKPRPRMGHPELWRDQRRFPSGMTKIGRGNEEG